MPSFNAVNSQMIFSDPSKLFRMFDSRGAASPTSIASRSDTHGTVRAAAAGDVIGGARSPYARFVPTPTERSIGDDELAHMHDDDVESRIITVRRQGVREHADIPAITAHTRTQPRRVIRQSAISDEPQLQVRMRPPIAPLSALEIAPRNENPYMPTRHHYFCSRPDLTPPNNAPPPMRRVGFEVREV